MARRKLSKQSEFKPDPRQNSLSGLFHVTQLQKQRMLKWTLYVLTGILLLTIQDVIMSRVSIFGATTDLPVVYILLITVIEGVDVGSLFVLFASTIYYFSGSAPGPYCIGLLCAVGIIATLLRQEYSSGDLALLKRENKNVKLTLETKLFLISFLKFDTCVDFENEIAYNIFELVLRGERMDCMNELASIAKEHGGIVETKIAIAHGISKAMLSKLCKEDKIHRVAQGQYIFPDDMQDELLSISKRTEQLIFSHETALFLHGISDRTPFEHTITVPSNYTPSVVIKAACKIYYIKPELFDMGKTLLKTPAGNEVPAYDLERTVCDMIRSRNKLGTETFLAALKMYAASPKKDLNKLNTYAKKMRVSNVLRQYLEVLL